MRRRRLGLLASFARFQSKKSNAVLILILTIASARVEKIVLIFKGNLSFTSNESTNRSSLDKLHILISHFPHQSLKNFV